MPTATDSILSLYNVPLSTDYLARSDFPGRIDDILFKERGGVVSSEFGIYQTQLDILSGNFKQSNSDNVLNYSSRNAFIQAEEAKSGSGKSYGVAYTGTKGYCILSVNSLSNEIKLAGDISAIANMLNGEYFDQDGVKHTSTYNTPGLNLLYNGTTGTQHQFSDIKFSFALDSNQGAANVAIKSVVEMTPEYGIVSVVSIPSELNSGASGKTEQEMSNLFVNDDNALYTIGYPELGNAVISNFYAQHAEGGSVRAIGKYTHAEGRDNTADVRYSHVEGSHNAACGMAAHVEGFYNVGFGRYVHVEGCSNKGYTTGTNVDCVIHVEGVENTVSAYCGAHAEGFGNTAVGKASHAEGYQTKAIDDYTHSEGFATSALVDYAHAEGLNTLASGSASHAEGSNTRATSACAHAEGISCIASGQQSHAEGYQTSATSNRSHAEGANTIASNEDAHVEGRSTEAAGPRSHAEGYYSHAMYEESHAEGFNTWSTAKGSHSEGYQVRADAKASHAAGIWSHALSTDVDSWVWNGVETGRSANNRYQSHGPGTFSVNPVGGTAGFYIGTQKLSDLLSNSSVKSEIVAALSNIDQSVVPSTDGSEPMSEIVPKLATIANALLALKNALS